MLVIDKSLSALLRGSRLRDLLVGHARERIVRCEGCGNYHVSVNGKIARHLCVGSA